MATVNSFFPYHSSYKSQCYQKLCPESPAEVLSTKRYRKALYQTISYLNDPRSNLGNRYFVYVPGLK